MDSVDERRSPSLPTAPTATSVPSISLSIPLLLAVPDPTMSCPQKPGAAHSLGIPAVMGIGELPIGRLEGVTAAVDGYRGRVFINPSPADLHQFEQIVHHEGELFGDLRSLRDQPAETPDGTRLRLSSNVALLSDITSSLNSGAEGVGLYRTEHSFMMRGRFPSEEEQYQTYRQMLEAFAPQPVAMRTLDIGGDKPLPYFPVTEDNPFLGWRGIRMTLDHPEIFLIQLRAMLRAN